MFEEFRVGRLGCGGYREGGVNVLADGRKANGIVAGLVAEFHGDVLRAQRRVCWRGGRQMKDDGACIHI